jgi:hypothetical protein
LNEKNISTEEEPPILCRAQSLTVIDYYQYTKWEVGDYPSFVIPSSHLPSSHHQTGSLLSLFVFFHCSLLNPIILRHFERKKITKKKPFLILF